jgi:hypothetical protein
MVETSHRLWLQADVDVDVGVGVDVDVDVGNGWFRGACPYLH